VPDNAEECPSFWGPGENSKVFVRLLENGGTIVRHTSLTGECSYVLLQRNMMTVRIGPIQLLDACRKKYEKQILVSSFQSFCSLVTAPKWRDRFDEIRFYSDVLCGLVVRVPGYRSRSSGFVSRRYQIFWEVAGLERGPLSLVRIIEELLEWKSSGSGQENRKRPGDPLRWPRNTLYPQKLALTLPTKGGRSVGIVRLRTKGHGV
jgi:hypothetical protein